MIVMAFWMTLTGFFILVLVQTVLVGEYCRALREVDPTPNRTFQPMTAVVLCLRGVDPFLRECIAALLAQDFRDYTVYCVFDHDQDPAKQVVDSFEDEKLVSVIAPAASLCCGLKNHLLATTIGQLSDDFEIVALVDADTVVDRHWLSDLVAPLNDPGTAVSTGSRWYLPPDTGMGTMVRYLWYVAASVQIYIYKVPWGGSMAVRMDYIRQTDLLQRWSHSLFEDTSITDHTFSHGKKTAIVPGLLMQNSESIDLSGASDWIQRQLFNARLYHGKFPLAIVHCFGSSLVLLAAIAVALGGFLSGAVTSGTMMVLVLIIYLLYYLAILAWLDSRAQDVLKKRNLSQADGAKRVARPTLFWRAVAIMITQCIYLRAMIGAMVQRRIRWRGIQYVAKRPFEIRMVEYRPMVDFETDQIGQPFRSLEL